MARFIATLKEVGFTGPLNIERETEDQSGRLRDIRAAIELVRGLAGPHTVQ